MQPFDGAKRRSDRALAAWSRTIQPSSSIYVTNIDPDPNLASLIRAVLGSESHSKPPAPEFIGGPRARFNIEKVLIQIAMYTRDRRTRKSLRLVARVLASYCMKPLLFELVIYTMKQDDIDKLRKITDSRYAHLVQSVKLRPFLGTNDRITSAALGPDRSIASLQVDVDDTIQAHDTSLARFGLPEITDYLEKISPTRIYVKTTECSAATGPEHLHLMPLVNILRSSKLASLVRLKLKLQDLKSIKVIHQCVHTQGWSIAPVVKQITKLEVYLESKEHSPYNTWHTYDLCSMFTQVARITWSAPVSDDILQLASLNCGLSGFGHNNMLTTIDISCCTVDLVNLFSPPPTSLKSAQLQSIEFVGNKPMGNLFAWLRKAPDLTFLNLRRLWYECKSPFQGVQPLRPSLDQIDPIMYLSEPEDGHAVTDLFLHIRTNQEAIESPAKPGFHFLAKDKIAMEKAMDFYTGQFGDA